MTGRLVAAVDLGASSGRVMVGRVAPNELELTEIQRFANEPVRLPSGLHWDILRLYREVSIGLRAAARAADAGGGLVSVAIDSWGVDHGLLDESGTLIGNPFHYRDERTGRAVIEAVHATVAPTDLYARNGLQVLPFTTIYQLAAARGTAALAAARTLLLIPDLFGFWLSGVRVGEVTNASTTGLLDVHRRTWDTELVEALGISAAILPPLAGPGEVIGPLRDDVRAALGASAETLVTLVGSHDTASAVVGVPATGDTPFAYIACGTWSLVGVELDQPVLGEASRTANFTNEGGVDDRIRYLRNVMGLWLLQESLRTWELAGTPEQLTNLLLAAGELPAGGPVIDPDDGTFLAPGDMPARIEDACVRSDQNPPMTRPALVRCILDSLAAAYGRALRDVERLSGQAVEVVHLVGGGARNRLLCQLTADASGLPVLAGPVEATALGNVLIQARARGLLAGDLTTLRALVRATQEIRRFEPRIAAARRGG
ncbi:MAG: rhamnulokinase family protein [Candidatus Limnocylindrales bacterium]